MNKRCFLKSFLLAGATFVFVCLCLEFSLSKWDVSFELSQHLYHIFYSFPIAVLNSLSWVVSLLRANGFENIYMGSDTTLILGVLSLLLFYFFKKTMVQLFFCKNIGYVSFILLPFYCAVVHVFGVLVVGYDTFGLFGGRSLYFLILGEFFFSSCLLYFYARLSQHDFCDSYTTCYFLKKYVLHFLGGSDEVEIRK